MSFITRVNLQLRSLSKVEGGRCCTLALAGGILLERGVALWWETREGTAEGRTLEIL